MDELAAETENCLCSIEKKKTSHNNLAGSYMSEAGEKHNTSAINYISLSRFFILGYFTLKLNMN